MYINKVTPAKNVINIKKDSKKLSEISQTTDVKFAFVSKNMEMVHEFVKCRDFLHDAVRAELRKQSVNIYGFQYLMDQKEKINLDRLVMLIRLPKSKHSNIAMTAARNIFYRIESDYKITKRSIVTDTYISNNVSPISGSIIFKVNLFDSKYDYFLLSSPYEWQSHPALLSLYTLIIKLSIHLVDNTGTIAKITDVLSPSSVNLTLEKITKVLCKKHDELFYDSRISGSVPTELKYLNSINACLHMFLKKVQNISPRFIESVNPLKYSYEYMEDCNASNFHNNYGIVNYLRGKTYDDDSKRKKLNKILFNSDNTKLKIKDPNNYMKKIISGELTMYKNIIVGRVFKEGKIRKINFPTVSTNTNNIGEQWVYDDSLRLLIAADKSEIRNIDKKMKNLKLLLKTIGEDAGLNRDILSAKAMVDEEKYSRVNTILLTCNKCWASNTTIITTVINLIELHLNNKSDTITYTNDTYKKKLSELIKNTKTFNRQINIEETITMLKAYKKQNIIKGM